MAYCFGIQYDLQHLDQQSLSALVVVLKGRVGLLCHAKAVHESRGSSQSINARLGVGY